MGADSVSMGGLRAPDEVRVQAPLRAGYHDDWFLPGERLFVVHVSRDGDTDVRVRCPETGADGWVEEQFLTKTTPKEG